MAGLATHTMADVVAAMRSRFYKGWSESQLQRKYTVYKDVMKFAVEEANNHKYEWTARRKAAAGTTTFYNAFQAVSAVRDTYDATLSVQPRTVMTHLGMVFDRLQLNKNRGSEDKLWDIQKMTMSACEEDRVETFETLFANCPSAVADDNAWLGWFYWFGESKTSGGTFVEQLEPARNGVYRPITGTATEMATMANQDTSTADNARFRSLVATHRGIIDDTTLKTLDRMIRDAEFEMIDGLEGEKPSGQYVGYWDDNFDSQYNDKLSALGGPKSRDYFNSGQKFVSGVPFKSVPSWNSLAKKPILLLNHQNLHFIKARGEWGLDDLELDTASPTAKAYPKVWTGQFRCRDIRTAGGLVHGSF